MIAATLLLLLSAGIALAQTVSNPRQVTLRWLRLGGIIALSLLAVAATILFMDRGRPSLGAALGLLIPSLLFIAQLIAAQLALRKTQRLASALAFLTSTALATAYQLKLLAQAAMPNAPHEFIPSVQQLLALTAQSATSSALLGGSLMAMLLGHAYLTAGNEMTQAPFRRLVIILAAALALRATLSTALGLYPWYSDSSLAGSFSSEHTWTVMLITARYLVGLAVPAVFLYMIHDCVQRRANQSATGILYVTIILLIIGEGSAITLLNATNYFF